MANGDTFNLSPSGWSFRDRHGHQVVKVRRLDHGEIPGNTEYLLSNGARYHSGCFTDGISYPNGDNISFYRGGELLFAEIGGRKVV